MSASKPHIWIVDDDASVRRVLSRALEQAGMQTREFDAPAALRQALAGDAGPDVLISDLRMPGESGLSLLGFVKDAHPALPVIVMTAYADLDNSVAALTGGAFELLPKPFDIDEAVDLVRRALVSAARSNQSVGAREAPGQPPSLIGSAPAMKALFRVIGRLAGSDLSVLLIGESGTGKERIARALHETSRRAEQRFVALNVAAIPGELLESELFGHEKGAFSGADQARAGYFEQAAGGTLFLDEIGDMPAETQTRLLRVLADGEFYRVGGHTPIRVDVRIIAATHQDLEDRVARGDFREDLFHRLNVIRIHIPRLSERREDIPRLMEFFFRKAAGELGGETKVLLPETERFLTSLEWPGNVRQLENTIRRLTVTSPSEEITRPEIEMVLGSQPAIEPLMGGGSGDKLSSSVGKHLRRYFDLHGGVLPPPGLYTRILKEVEMPLIEIALEATGGNQAKCAELLGINRNTLRKKITDLDIRVTRRRKLM